MCNFHYCYQYPASYSTLTMILILMKLKHMQLHNTKYKIEVGYILIWGGTNCQILFTFMKVLKDNRLSTLRMHVPNFIDMGSSLELPLKTKIKYAELK